MKKLNSVNFFLVVSLAMIVALAGCSTTKQARSLDEENAGILGDYSMVKPGEGDQALMTYRNTNANWKKYTKVIIDPVKFQIPENASEEEMADLQKLVNNMEILLRSEVGSDYLVVKNPGPDTLRVRAAIFNAKKKRVVGNTISSIVPIGAALSVIKDVAVGKPMSVGEISGEMKVDDSESGELLAAAIDRRVGQKYSKGTFDSWAEANDAIELWAKRLRFALCEVRGGATCVKPE